MKHYELEDTVEEPDDTAKPTKLKGFMSRFHTKKEPEPEKEPLPSAPPKTKNISELAAEQARKKLVMDRERERALSQVDRPQPLRSDDDLFEPDPAPRPVVPEPQPIPQPEPEPLPVKKKGLARIANLFKRKPKQPKPVKVPVPQEVRQRSIYKSVDTAILLFAFLVGAVSVILVYREIPTHPYLIIGIAGIAVSVGIITGINRW